MSWLGASVDPDLCHRMASLGHDEWKSAEGRQCWEMVDAYFYVIW